MDRAADFESVGREFESPQARHVFNQALSRQAGNPVTLSAAMAFEASVLVIASYVSARRASK